MSRKVLKAMALGCVAAGLFISAAAPATQLITEEEAKQQQPKGAVAVDRRAGILRGPKVALVSPADATHSPLRLKLKFESFGGTKIDPDSVRVVFLSTPNVDLTPRVKPFVHADGIDMPDAELPPGEYTVRVDVKDNEGHSGTTIFVLRVVP